MELVELLIITGLVLFLLWHSFLAGRQRQHRAEITANVERDLRRQVTAVTNGSSGPPPEGGSMVLTKLDEETITRQLTRYAGHESFMQTYVQGLVDRYQSKIVIEVLHRWGEEADARIDLTNKLIAGIETEGALRRTKAREELRDKELELSHLELATRQLEAEMKKTAAEAHKVIVRQDKEREIKNAQELEDLKTEYEKEQYRAKIRELQKPPADPPIKEEDRDPTIEEQIEQADTALRIVEEKCRSKRQALYPHNFENEGIWITTVREKLGPDADVTIEQYEQYRLHLFQILKQK